MASDVNRLRRKRKSITNLVFEVNETDFSPSNSPDLIQKESYSVIKAAKMPLMSTDLSNELIESEIVSGLNVSTKLEQLDIKIEDSVNTIKMTPTEDVIKEEVVDKRISEIESSKSDVDLRCMDMEVDNSPPTVVGTEKPYISLTFRDKDIANKLRPQIVDFIKTVANFEFFEIFDSEVTVNLWESISTNETYDTKVQVTETTKCEKVELFVEDKTPSKRHETLPRYKPKVCSVIGESHVEHSQENELNFRSGITCYNCDGNHSLKDCKMVRDPQRIQNARNKQSKLTRYHVDGDLKHNHLVPGKISEQLRRALDVRKDEIPYYIYRMRVLGYPPGWLQEAVISNSDLELFDFQGCAIKNGNKITQKIDPSKIIEYPGFNMPLTKGYKDEYKYFNCPPYNENFSKESMLKFIAITTQQIVNNQSNETPSLAKNEEYDSNSQGSEVTSVCRSSSPTLNDLELQKRQLLAKLEEDSLSSPQSNTETNDKQLTSTPISPLIESPNVVSSSFGTPIIKSTSPYVQLPDRDKFSRDISQVINFENLPNATGKYEQMSKVIDKVRNVVKNNSFEDKIDS